MNNTRKTLIAVVAIVSTLSMQAYAALPMAATTAFDDVKTDGLALIDLAWPLAIALTTGSIILGLFKKFAKKAAS